MMKPDPLSEPVVIGVVELDDVLNAVDDVTDGIADDGPVISAALA
jgi:hypothetical protein